MQRIAKVGRLEAVALSLIGWLLFCEIGAAVRWNVTFLHRDVVFDPRFSLYVWTSVGVAILLMLRGVTAASSTGQALRLFATLEGPLALIVGVIAIYIAHVWRLATDNLPADRLDTSESLPLVVALMTRPVMFWLVAAGAAFMLLIVFWKRTPDATSDAT